MMPCSAFEPNTTAPGPFKTSTRPACSKLASNSWLTLQKPGDRMLMPSSAVMKAPQLPAPVNTGERNDTKDSCPLPRLTQAPETRLNSWLLCWAATRSILAWSRIAHDVARSNPASSVRRAVTITVSTSSRFVASSLSASYCCALTTVLTALKQIASSNVSREVSKRGKIRIKNIL